MKEVIIKKNNVEITLMDKDEIESIYATKDEIDNVLAGDTDLTGYAKKIDVNNAVSTKTINVEKQTTAENGYAATYVIKQNNTQVGAKINIPKDFLVKSASLKTCSVKNNPEQGYNVGDKYLDFVVNTDSENNVADSHIYINVKDLVDIYVHPNSGVTAGTNYNKNQTPDFDNTFNIPKLTFDAQGHITASSTSTVKIPAFPTITETELSDTVKEQSFIKVKSISSISLDLNDYYTPEHQGKYWCSPASITTLSHAPWQENNRGGLLLIVYNNDGARTVQIAYRTYKGNEHIYWRVYDNGWGSNNTWQEVAKVSDIPDISGKLNISQGTSNSGKYMVVNSSGNIAPASLPTIPSVSNSLTDTSTTNALSAAQGKALNENKRDKTDFYRNNVGAKYEYVQVLQIKIKSGYANVGISFDIHQRKKSPSHCDLLFTQSNKADTTNVESFTYIGGESYSSESAQQEIYIDKIDTATWCVIVKQFEANGAISVSNLTTATVGMANKVEFSLPDNTTYDMPSNAVPYQARCINRALTATVTYTDGSTETINFVTR